MSELMMGLWESQNMYPPFSFQQKLSHMIPWIFMQWDDPPKIKCNQQ
jgi:hypothetical protein